jgi:TonB family protein
MLACDISISQRAAMTVLMRTFLRWSAAVAAVAGVAACVAPPAPAPTPAPAPAPRPSVTAPPTVVPLPSPSLSEADWRRAMAQHIQAVNRQRVFEGRPPHPLKAIVVLELTVAADGRIERASVLRAPAHARELGGEAVRTVQAASPLPAPPRALLSRGSVRLTETWLFRNDNLFQLRSLAQNQLIQ